MNLALFEILVSCQTLRGRFPPFGQYLTGKKLLVKKCFTESSKLIPEFNGRHRNARAVLTNEVPNDRGNSFHEVST